MGLKLIINKKNMKNLLIKNIWLTIVITLILGVIFGKLFTTSTGENEMTETENHEHKKGEIWTCSMDPQVKRDKPGSCPICGMDLILLENDISEDPMAVSMSEAAMKIAEVQTSIVSKKDATKEIFLSGKIAADERRINIITAHYAGRIDKLYVNFTGQPVRKGQVLATIYSPELVTAQKELLEAVKLKSTSPQFYTAAINKLKLWKLTNAQIAKIEASGNVRFHTNILSPISGTVTKRNITVGDHVMEGTDMFEVVNLKSVWVIFDAFESDIPWIKINDEIHITLKSAPNKQYKAKVTFIDPTLDPVTRTAKIRVELTNKEGQLKPGMFAKGMVNTQLKNTSSSLLIPKSAVLWTGKESVVYVKNTSSKDIQFSYRMITLGEEAGENYIVLAGLNEGEEIATNGVFKIDAAAQLQGKPSMMNGAGTMHKVAGHKH